LLWEDGEDSGRKMTQWRLGKDAGAVAPGKNRKGGWGETNNTAHVLGNHWCLATHGAGKKRTGRGHKEPVTPFYEEVQVGAFH